MGTEFPVTRTCSSRQNPKRTISVSLQTKTSKKSLRDWPKFLV